MTENQDLGSASTDVEYDVEAITSDSTVLTSNTDHSSVSIAECPSFCYANETKPDIDEKKNEEDSSLIRYAKYELEREGILNTNETQTSDTEYTQMIGEAVLELIKVFAKQGHSGHSANVTAALFAKLAHFEPLGEFHPTIKESMEIGTSPAGEIIYQSTRKATVFSNDGGKTWTDVDDPDFHYTNYIME